MIWPTASWFPSSYNYSWFTDTSVSFIPKREKTWWAFSEWFKPAMLTDVSQKTTTILREKAWWAFPEWFKPSAWPAFPEAYMVSKTASLAVKALLNR